MIAKSKKAKRVPWKSIRCPNGCGARWHHYVYIYEGGSVCRVYWTKGQGSFAFAPMANRPIPSFRVLKDGKTWMVHPNNPAWKDSSKVKRCC